MGKEGKDGGNRMNREQDDVRKQLGNNGDFFRQELLILDSPVVLMGLLSLIDLPRTMARLPLGSESAPASQKPNDRLQDLEALGSGWTNDPASAVASILAGKLVLYDKISSAYLTIEPVPKSLERAVQEPSSQSVVQSSMASFVESIDANIGLVRLQFKSPDLQVKRMETGTSRQTNLAVLYHKGRADLKLVQRIESRLETGRAMDIDSMQDLSQALGFPKWSAISKFNSTELPDEVARALSKGKVVLFMDRLPFALVLPHLLWDSIAIGADHHFPRPIMIATRAIRAIGLISTIILPALYVALVAVNPEVLRIQLALSIAQSREGVPYPAFVETLIMLVLLELILEASVRLPRSVGPTITMVGGIILGQAVVEAKLVSNLLIIILAATTIANSTIVGVQNGFLIRALKYVTVLLASIFGVLGIYAGVVLICGVLASENTLGMSYVRLPFAKDEVEHE